MKRCAWPMFVAVWLSMWSLGVNQAHADSCFDLPDTRGESAGSSARKITLGARVSTKATCEYALSPDATWNELGALQSDFAGLVDTLATRTRTQLNERPTTIFARKRQTQAGSQATQGNIESIFLAGCTEYLLTEAHGFSLRVPIDTQRPTVTRHNDVATCGADRVGLYVAAMPATTRAPLLRRGAFDASLSTTAHELVLEPGAYAIYAARGEDGVGYLLGRVATGSSMTPLREALTQVQQGASSAWLRATWAHGQIQLAPISDALKTSDAWAELRTATATQAAWLQRRPKPQDEPIKLGKVAMNAEGDAIQWPGSEVTRAMTDRYGAAGQFMTPDLSEWQQVTDGVELCVANRYALPQAGTTLTTGVNAQCVAVSRLLAPMSIAGGMDLGTGRVCVQDNLRVMTASGAKAGRDLPETCTDLQATADTPPTILLVTRGSQLRFEGSGSDHLFACLDNDCRPMPSGDTTLPLERSGLLEIRHADTRDNARSAQALTRARIGVLDVERQWHPVGLHTASIENGSGPWTSLLHNADHVFTYTRRRQHLDFRISLTPTLAAAWNQRAVATTQLTQNLPQLGGMQGELEGSKPPALVTLVTRQAECPEQAAGEISAAAPVDPEQLLPDQDFYVHLAQTFDAATPMRCLARAHFRVVDSRSLRATDQIRVGLLGDVQLAVFITRPAAIGLTLPLVYGFWRWGYGFGLDGSISLSSAITFDPSQVSRAGLMASTALVWGPEHIAPRLLSFGVALHGATGTHKDAPFGSVFAALNLSSLIDLAGGR